MAAAIAYEEYCTIAFSVEPLLDIDREGAGASAAHTAHEGSRDKEERKRGETGEERTGGEAWGGERLTITHSRPNRGTRSQKQQTLLLILSDTRVWARRREMEALEGTPHDHRRQSRALGAHAVKQDLHAIWIQT